MLYGTYRYYLSRLKQLQQKYIGRGTSILVSYQYLPMISRGQSWLKAGIMEHISLTYRTDQCCRSVQYGSGSGSRSGVLVNENWRKYKAEKINIKKNYFSFPSASIKDAQATGEAFSHLSLKIMRFLIFLLFCHCSSFLPLKIQILRIQPTKINPDTCGSGSATLTGR